MTDDEKYLAKLEAAVKGYKEKLRNVDFEKERIEKKKRFEKILAMGRVAAQAGLIDCNLDRLFFVLVKNKNKILGTEE